MMIDVGFEQTEMGFQPAFDTLITLGEGGMGVVFVPNVSAEGILSWSNNGGLSNPEPINVKGKDGYTPIKGQDYYTDAEKAELMNKITESVIAALPVYKGEVAT